MSEDPDQEGLEFASTPKDLNEYLQRFRLIENGGRRLGIDRRQYRYTLIIPERRNGYERRIGHNRRKDPRIVSKRSLKLQAIH